MQTLTQQAVIERARALALWKLRALLGVQFVLLAEQGKAGSVREVHVSNGVPSCMYGFGDFGRVQLRANGSSSDARYSWEPLTAGVASHFTSSMVSA